MSHMPMFYFRTSNICHIHRYVYASVLWVTRDQKLKRGGMLYRVAQDKWDLLLKLCMGYFLTSSYWFSAFLCRFLRPMAPFTTISSFLLQLAVNLFQHPVQ